MLLRGRNILLHRFDHLLTNVLPYVQGPGTSGAEVLTRRLRAWRGRFLTTGGQRRCAADAGERAIKPVRPVIGECNREKGTKLAHKQNASIPSVHSVL